jgi:hypothetical protein
LPGYFHTIPEEGSSVNYFFPIFGNDKNQLMKKIYIILFALPFIIWGCPAKTPTPPPAAPATPKACFSVNKTLFDSGETLVFSNGSKNTTSYVWDFGDGLINASTDQNPTHVYGNNRTAYHLTLKAYNADKSKESDTSANLTEGHRQIDSIRINSVNGATFKPGINYVLQFGPGTNTSLYNEQINTVQSLPMTFKLESDTIIITHGKNDNSWKGRILSQPAGSFVLTFGGTGAIFFSRGLNNSPLHFTDNGVDMNVWYHLVK